MVCFRYPTVIVVRAAHMLPEARGSLHADVFPRRIPREEVSFWRERRPRVPSGRLHLKTRKSFCTQILLVCTHTHHEDTQAPKHGYESMNSGPYVR